ncbi:MAG: hypothetical protein FWF81_11950 [Defluviitaleaceae bacterium]|nr:hypothetical protein [Defluviitaleaceae bacterium]
MNSKTNGKVKQIGRRLPLLAAAIVAAVAVLGIIVTLSISANPALPEIRDIFTLYDNYNMTVVVVFDEEPPIVQFIAPDGESVDMKTIRYRTGSNFTQYFLPNSMPGVWRMAYDPLTNNEITTPYSVYMESIFIRDFTVQMARDEDGNIPVSFEVSADDGGEFSYELHAIFTDPDNSIADEILLAMGYGMLNETLALAVDTGEIQEMGGFMLRLTVSVQHGQASIRDSAWLDFRLTS